MNINPYLLALFIGIAAGMIYHYGYTTKEKEKLYSYTDGKHWYMCDDHNLHCYTDRFKY